MLVLNPGAADICTYAQARGASPLLLLLLHVPGLSSRFPPFPVRTHPQASLWVSSASPHSLHDQA